MRGLRYYKNMVPVYGVMFLFSLHYYLVLYVNSSNLKRFWSEDAIGNLYTYGSVITLAILIFSSKILKQSKVKYLFYSFLFLESLAIFLLSFVSGQYFSGVGFLLLQTASPLVFFAIDIFMEELNKNANHKGGARSILLTATNITVMVSPLISTYLIAKYSFESAYVVSFLLVIPVFILSILSMKKMKEPKIESVSSLHALKAFSYKKDLRRVFEANFILKIFYAIMVVYVPIYLNTKIGFSLSEIGIMFTIMLIPFVIFEIPFGTIADKWLGEKEIMISGFILSGLSVLFMFMYPQKDIVLFSVLLFLSRVGASAIEISTESFFFKKVKGNEIDIISFFRVTNPLSFMIAPFIVMPVVHIWSQGHILLVLAIITFAGVIPSILIKDTK